jgi:hypothetical protein
MRHGLLPNSHTPSYFLPDISSGKSLLSEEGKKAVQDELARVRRKAS